jgi:sarcosine oxidase subunit alpha
MSTLLVGRARYGLMLREDGMVMDDGTVARLAPGHFVLTTTTANAANVLQHMEFCRQVLWPELDAELLSVTDQWAQFAIAGLRSRAVVQGVAGSGQNFSNVAFPHLSAATIQLACGVTGRLFRVSYSGELAFELAIPARDAGLVLHAILAAGEQYGIMPYGTEALGMLRVEKGHVAGGELNGQTTARDLGLERMLSRRKDFIGRVMAQRPALIAPDRPALVGVRPVDRSAKLSSGAHFLDIGAAATATNDRGWVSSAVFSPSLGHSIGLGFLSGGQRHIGQRMRAFDPVRGADIEVEVVSPCFVDPEGERLRV